MYKPIGIALGVYALILWVLVFFVFHKGYKEWKTNRANRVHKHRARVLDKRESKGAEGVPQQYLLFGFDDRQVELKVEPSVFASLRVGDEGVLGVRGGLFESFEAKTQDEKSDEIYRRMIKD
jgi:hypothetical protein